MSAAASSSTAPSGASSSSRFCIVVVGPGGVGKSALTIQYIQGVFVDSYDPTIMDSLMKADSINGQNVVVTVVDTAGQSEYVEHIIPYLRVADLCVFVFSLTDKASAGDIATTFDRALATRSNKRLPFLLVGNKKDLADHRVMSEELGRRLAVGLAMKMALSQEEKVLVGRNPPYMETSAKVKEDAVAVFRSGVEMVMALRGGGIFGKMRGVADENEAPKSGDEPAPAVPKVEVKPAPVEETPQPSPTTSSVSDRTKSKKKKGKKCTML